MININLFILNITFLFIAIYHNILNGDWGLGITGRRKRR